ncbi:MAG TPA: hypothetical protein VHB97_17255, partial [Polyangia bacterium]|nr:hypothetical protein [Polyangia bacterium]
MAKKQTKAKTNAKAKAKTKAKAKSPLKAEARKPAKPATTPRATTPARAARDVDTLRERLREAEETLDAIRSGQVDALVVQGAAGDQVFTLR